MDCLVYIQSVPDQKVGTNNRLTDDTRQYLGTKSFPPRINHCLDSIQTDRHIVTKFQF